MRIVLCLIFGLFFLSCTNPSGAKEALEAEGFENVQITGFKWFSCSKDDFFHTGFTATGRNGKPISGTVCEGLLFKGRTIRF